MKITFKEGGDFQIEPQGEEQAHSREAVRARAALRYGEPPVYFDALKHGTFASFEQSPDYSASKTQIRKSIDSLRQFLERKHDPVNRAASAQIDEFGKRVESGSTGFFSTRVALAHSMGKEALEQLAFSIENPQVGEDRREVALKNLAPELIACADGAIDQLVRRARLLELESAGGLKFNARSEWEKMLSQSILEFVQKRFGLRQNYRNNEIHFHNAFWNHLASRYGMTESVDDFIASLGLTDADHEACERHVTQQVTPGRLVHHVAENCLAEIRGAFRAVADRPLSPEEVFAFYGEFEHWALTELHERFGVIPPGALFSSYEDEHEETRYRMIRDPALLMATIGENLVKSGLLNAFPVTVIRESGQERILQLAYQAFVVHHAQDRTDRSLTLDDLAGMGDALTPRMVVTALRNTDDEALAQVPADRMTHLLESESEPFAWLVRLSDTAVRRYRASRSDAEPALFSRIAEKMRALGAMQQELAFLAATKAGDEPVAAFLARGFTTVRGFDGHGNSALHYAASQQMLTVIERLEGKLDFNVRNIDDRTPLMAAVAAGKVQAMQALLDRRADLERTDPQGRTALLLAAAYDRPDAMAALLDRGALPTHTDSNGWDVLLVAAAHDGAAAIAELAQRGFDMEHATSTGITALMVAARYGRRAAVQALAAQRVDPNRSTAHGVTALMCASQLGHASVIDPLLDCGAALDHVTSLGMTAVMLAAQNGHADTIDRLAARGADLEKASHQGMTALLLAVAHGKAAAVAALVARHANQDHVGPGGMTALLWAAKIGDPAMLETLIGAGADIHCTVDGRFNAVMVAAMNDRSAAIEALAGKLDVNLVNANGETALMLAASRNCVEAIKTLVSKGADLERGDARDRSALLFAADNAHVEALQTLLTAGADVARADIHGMTALALATRHDDPDAINVLLDHGANLEHDHGNGVTALMMAAQDGNPDVLEALLDRGAAIDRQDDRGFSALIHAARGGRSEAVALLLDRGADARLRDRSGDKALAHAQEEGHHEVIGLLLGEGSDGESDDSTPASSSRSSSPSPSTSPARREDPSASAEPSAKRLRR